MYAIIVTGGKQYRVQKGDVVFVEKLNAEEGSTVKFENVLAVGGEGDTKVGTPNVEGASVEAKVVKNGKGKKLNIITYRPKKGSARRMGHRQPYTKVEITAINGRTAAIPSPSVWASSAPTVSSCWPATFWFVSVAPTFTPVRTWARAATIPCSPWLTARSASSVWAATARRSASASNGLQSRRDKPLRLFWLLSAPRAGHTVSRTARLRRRRE